jgi:hypothetical protein
MLDEIEIGLEPFRAFFAVVLSETGEVFTRFGGKKGFEVCGVVNVGVDLVEVASVAPGLFDRGGAADRGHFELFPGLTRSEDIGGEWLS